MRMPKFWEIWYCTPRLNSDSHALAFDQYRLCALPTTCMLLRPAPRGYPLQLSQLIWLSSYVTCLAAVVVFQRFRNQSSVQNEYKVNY